MYTAATQQQGAKSATIKASEPLSASLLIACFGEPVEEIWRRARQVQHLSHSNSAQHAPQWHL